MNDATTSPGSLQSSASGQTGIELRTGIWHNDRLIRLDFPSHWDVKTWWPNTPPPLSEEEIRQRVENPIGQAPLRELAKGRKRPCIITDDLSRPTPVARVMPYILEQFAAAGITPEDITIVIATGTHGHQDMGSIANKIGEEGMRCRVLIHDDLKHTKKIGKTSYGTPVYVDQDVLACDMVIGVGGVYPQHTTGFGGGGKLALGVLGRRSIMGLHYTHPTVGGKYIIDNDFRRDVTEMARMIGLDTIYTLHINAHLEVVSLMAGDHYSYYPEAAAFSHDRYLTTAAEEDTDVVIANAYPLDTSFTFMRKGYKPLVAAPRSAMKIMVASAYEGVGHHGLFQHIKPPRALRMRMLYRRLATLGIRGILKKVWQKVLRKLGRGSPAASQPRRGTSQVKAIPRNTDHLWVFRTDDTAASLPDVEDMTVLTDWQSILDAIARERDADKPLKVRIYPCAPLQTVSS